MADFTIFADENVHSSIIKTLRSSGFEVVAVGESMAGATDVAVLEAARSLPAVLLTEDSDFGELVFSHGMKATGIVYLRYEWNNLDSIVRALLQVLLTQDLSGVFTTITTTKIRQRRLP